MTFFIKLHFLCLGLLDKISNFFWIFDTKKIVIHSFKHHSKLTLPATKRRWSTWTSPQWTNLMLLGLSFICCRGHWTKSQAWIDTDFFFSFKTLVGWTKPHGISAKTLWWHCCARASWSKLGFSWPLSNVNMKSICRVVWLITSTIENEEELDSAPTFDKQMMSWWSWIDLSVTSHTNSWLQLPCSAIS